MATTKNKTTQMLATLDKLKNTELKNESTHVVQEIKPKTPPKKVGRKSHREDGIEYVRMTPAIPVDLKNEMEVAMRTTHKEYPTIDTFVTEAVRVFLALKK
jgi:hypothetical protein